MVDRNSIKHEYICLDTPKSQKTLARNALQPFQRCQNSFFQLTI